MKGYPAGVVTALNFAVQAVTDSGDEILIPSPVYAPLYIVSKDGVRYYLADGHEVNEDALPIQEETGLPFVSQIPGVMHTCGHNAACSAVTERPDAGLPVPQPVPLRH